ncbi:MAG: serine hydrolase domain-containing protein [Pseudolabrys sp.]|jgi:CubicO group peptidase (beta-lactamase class C family)
MAFDMPRANKPEDVGLSSPRLQRIRDTLQADVDKGAVPGAVMLIARRGQIASLEALGYRDREDGAVMRPDTIFRIASMTKPVTSVAAMMLAEEGKLLIADPVSRYIPAFANLKVATNSDDATAKTLAVEPPQREMTVQDLLRHTSGLTYAHLTGPHIKQAYEAANVVDERQNNAAMAENLGRVPLAYQPGNPKRCRFAATSVQYNAVVLKNDLPFSKDASNIEFDPNKPLLTLISGEPTVSAVCVTGLGVVKMVLIGDFFWSGVTGTNFWIDPQQELIAILLMQAPLQRLHHAHA